MCIGSIVRIRPDSLHINDPNLIDQVQGTATDRRDKSKLDCNMMMSPGAFISTPENGLHRKRHAILTPSQNRVSVRIEPVLQDALRKILDRFTRHAISGIPIRTHLLFTAAASDVISEYAVEQSRNSLDKDDLKSRSSPLWKTHPKCAT